MFFLKHVWRFSCECQFPRHLRHDAVVVFATMECESNCDSCSTEENLSNCIVSQRLLCTYVVYDNINITNIFGRLLRSIGIFFGHHPT